MTNKLNDLFIHILYLLENLKANHRMVCEIFEEYLIGENAEWTFFFKKKQEISHNEFSHIVFILYTPFPPHATHTHTHDIPMETIQNTLQKIYFCCCFSKHIIIL